MTDQSEWQSDEKFAAVAAYLPDSVPLPGSKAGAGGEGGEKKLSKNQLKKLAKNKVRIP